MRRVTLVVLALFAFGAPPTARAQSEGGSVVLYGVGTAHGLGMAMDGVEGQARAGWTHDRILDLFYPGSKPGRASGTIRVGLATGGEQSFVLPGGGTVTGRTAARRVRPGERITVVASGGRAVLRGSPAPARDAVTDPAPRRLPLSAPTDPLASPPPLEDIVPPTPPPAEPSPVPTPPPSPRATAAPAAGSALRIEPDGSPALVRVEATGRSYRGWIEVAPSPEGLRVVNHVDLEQYVMGIAEEKGAGWPLEGLKTLAVAARSLGAATMTWYTKSRPFGYDICPTQNCQVYLGYDGEEPLMRQAVAETAGQIREFNGRPILAMYHGNGGGVTESYRRVAMTKTDPHPYLRSVRYPYADPSTWRRELTYREIAGALAARGVSVPANVSRLEILERGDSPRVIRMRVHGDGRHVDITGTTFMMALDLWSTWFEIGRRTDLTAVRRWGAPSRSLGTAAPLTGDAHSAGVLDVLAVALLALALATTLQLTGARLRLPLRLALRPLRTAP